MKHQWQVDSRGEPDTSAHAVVAETMEHAGPRCTVCGFFFCESCYPAGWQRECPGPAPDGKEYDWIGDGTGIPPETPEFW